MFYHKDSSWDGSFCSRPDDSDITCAEVMNQLTDVFIFQETDDYRYFDPKMLRGSERYHSNIYYHSDQFSNKLRNVSPSSLLFFLLFFLIFSSSIPRNKNPFQEVSRVSVSGLKFDGWVSVSGISRTNRVQRLETMLHSRKLLTTIKPISSLHSWIQTQNTSSGTSLQFDLLQKEPGLNKSVDIVMIQQFNTDGNLQLYNQHKIFRRKSDMKNIY